MLAATDDCGVVWFEVSLRALDLDRTTKAFIAAAAAAAATSFNK